MNVKDLLQAVQSGTLSPEQAKQALGPRAAEPAPAAPAAAVTAAQQPIAIIGMSGRYPQAPDLDRYWDLLREGRDAVCAIPPTRWRTEEYYDPAHPREGQVYALWLGLLDDIDCFDPLFFAISPGEAELMDPQHRLFMQEAYKAFEDAGYAGDALEQLNCGVYFGIMSREYGDLMLANPHLLGNLTGTSASIGAARVSYYLNMRGPAIPVDTACSSSLVATHLACQALRSGEIDMALSGGATVYISPYSYYGMCAAGMLSPSGRCRAFDARADGFVPGEGVGTLVLKRLADAEAAGDGIHGLIIASGINQDGRTNGITAPSKASQAELVRNVYRRFSIDPTTLGYVEMHGTGTNLGDPIELSALATAFRELTAERNFCAIGSVKSNIGHTSAAAGVAGVHKVLLCMRHGQFVPTLHFDTPNRHFDFARSPFRVNTELQPWPRQGAAPRRAAVSSFGYSGTNAHLVIEEYARAAPARPAQGPFLFVLSALDAAALRRYAAAMAHWIDAHPTVALDALCYTVQIGRAQREHRLALLVNDTQELLRGLQAYGEGRDEPYLRRGDGTTSRLAEAMADRDDIVQIQREWFGADPERLADLWVKGMDVDWLALRRTNAAQRISLPTYPFARERYWLEFDLSVPGGSTPVEAAAAPPMQEALQLLAPVWQPVPAELIAPAPSSAPDGGVLVVGASAAQFAAIAAELPRAVALLPATDFVSDSSAAAIAHAIAQAGAPIAQVFWFCPAADSDAQRAGYSATLLFDLIKALLAHDLGVRSVGWTVVTLNTQAVAAGESVDPSYSGLQGLLGAMAKEYPNWPLRLLDLEREAVLGVAELHAVPPVPGGGVCAHRGGRWLTQHLAPLQVDGASPSVYRNGGVYVVLGGAGGVGEAWTEWMIRHYDAQVVWLGRRAEDAAIGASLDRLGALGRRPWYIAVDANDRAALQTAYATLRARLGAQRAINGVIHSALLLDDHSLANMRRDQFLGSLRVKVDASIHLAAVFAAEPLDFLLFFSSIQSFTRAAGQANYAAGCTFQDTFARQLDQRWPCAVKVVNWGYWGSVGVAASADYRERMAQVGLGSIEVEEGMQALELLLCAPLQQLAVLKLSDARVLDYLCPTGQRLHLALPQQRLSLTQEEFAPAPLSTAAAPAETAAPAALAGDGDALDLLQARARDSLTQIAAAVLKLDPARIDARTRLEKYGLDSIVAVQMAAKLNHYLGNVGSTLFVEYRTIEALAAHLIETRRDDLAHLYGVDAAAAAAAAAARAAPPAAIAAAAVPPAAGVSGAAQQAVAVIAINGRFARAGSVDALWQRLRDGEDCISEVPAERWQHDGFFDVDKTRIGKTYCRWGGFIDGVDEFDPLFFDFSPALANYTDPQVRLFLQTSWDLLEQAGYTRERIETRHASSVGVFVGATYHPYQTLDMDYLVHAGVSLSSYSVISNRVSNFFDFKGPSVAVDTQCSSALMAVHMARQSLLNGECELAIAGGVNLMLSPKKYLGMSVALMLGSHLRCRTFADGDGFLPSEAIGAVLLKPLARAVADRDPILGVIRASAQCHGGRGIGYGTQDPNAQYELVRRCLQHAGIAARTISYVEAAANGTGMSDAIEAAALRRAFAEQTREQGFCVIGSVKSNLGHCEAASGLSQLAKVLLQLRHRQIPPSIYLEQPNPAVDFSASAFRFEHALTEWQRPRLRDSDGEWIELPRRALVNSFGGGGSLCCAVVEEYAPDLAGSAAFGLAAPPLGATPATRQLIPLSARSEERLRAAAQQLRDFLQDRPALALADVAYTLQRGREAMACRLALVVDSTAALCAALDAYLHGLAPPSPATLAQGWTQSDAAGAALAAIPDGGAVDALAAHWCGGGEVDWERLSAAAAATMIALPGYPFEKRRYWLPSVESSAYADSLQKLDAATQPVVVEAHELAARVHAEIGAFFGLEPDELALDTPLARFELPQILAPRLGHHLRLHLGLTIDPARLTACQTAQDVLDLLPAPPATPRTRRGGRAAAAKGTSTAAKRAPAPAKPGKPRTRKPTAARTSTESED